MKAFVILLITIILTLFIASFTYADTIKMNNGDILVGKIISQTETSIIIRTSFGDIRVRREDVQEVKMEMDSTTQGERALVILKDGTQLRGIITKRDGTSITLLSNFGELKISKNKIAKIKILYEEGEDANLFEEGDIDDIADDDERLFQKKLEYKEKTLVIQQITFKTRSKDAWQIKSGNFIIDDEEFLRKIGKFKEADRTAKKRVRKIIYRVTGGVSLLSGGVFFVVYGLQPSKYAFLIAGIGTSVVGTALLFASWPKKHYLTYAEAQEYADEYNNELRKQLGLTETDILLISMEMELEAKQEEEKQKFLNLEPELHITLLNFNTTF